MTTRSLANLICLLLLACRGRDGAMPSDPATTPGPTATCAVDTDCAPSSPCGLTADGLCLNASEVSNASVECARPKRSTHRCVCDARRCAVVPLSRGAPPASLPSQ